MGSKKCAMILAAGLGTRLKEITRHTPKALVEVGGEPMLKRVIDRLSAQGFDEIIINAFHLADQIIDYINKGEWDVEIKISDERPELLDTGGGIVKGAVTFEISRPLLIHNVDILSNADLKGLYAYHCENNLQGITLLMSERESTRKLIFDKDNSLIGWHDLRSDEVRPAALKRNENDKEYSFSGIYVVSAEAIKEMGEIMEKKNFGIMDYLLHERRRTRAIGMVVPDLQLIDIGKPATLLQAQNIFDKNS